MLCVFCVAGASAFYDDEPGPISPLIELWSREFSTDIDWLSLRSSRSASRVLIHTRDGRLHLFDAHNGAALHESGWNVEPGTRLIARTAGEGASDWGAVHGRFSVSGVYLGDATQDSVADRRNSVQNRDRFWQVGAPLVPSRDAQGDPEFLGGITAGGQNSLGILIAGSRRTLRLFTNESGEMRDEWRIEGDVRQVEPRESGWAILARAGARIGISWLDFDAAVHGRLRLVCDLGDFPPTWFGAIGRFVVSIFPSAVELVDLSGDARRFAPAGDAWWLPNQAVRMTDRTGRALLLVPDQGASVTAFDCDAGRRAWTWHSEEGRDACLGLDGDEEFVVRVQSAHADVIDLLTGRRRTRVVFPANEPVISAFVENGCLMLVTRASPDHAVERMRAVRGESEDSYAATAGFLRAWWLSDGRLVGVRGVAFLPDGARVEQNAATLVIHARGTVNTYALDLP